jgi:NAD(P)H-hydrate epimerase
MIAGAYLHGLSGDIAKESLGEESMTAQDLIDNLGQSFLKIA